MLENDAKEGDRVFQDLACVLLCERVVVIRLPELKRPADQLAGPASATVRRTVLTPRSVFAVVGFCRLAGRRACGWRGRGIAAGPRLGWAGIRWRTPRRGREVKAGLLRRARCRCRRR